MQADATVNQIINGRHHGWDLNAGDSAEFAAGMIYAYSGQTSDVRDYLVECSVQNSYLDRHLTNAFYFYSDGPDRDVHQGNTAMKRSNQFATESMADCADTQDQWQAIVDNAEAFTTSEDWMDTVRANYAANTAVIDHLWSFYLSEFGNGVYFNAGMFYGRTYMALSTGSFSYTNRLF